MKLTQKPKQWKKKGNENKANHFSMSKRWSWAADEDLSWWVLIEETYSLSVSATTGPCPFISGRVTIKSQRCVMASAAVGLFGSEGCVQFMQCSQSYGGSCWIFIATCPLPSPGWAYRMRNHMRSLTTVSFLRNWHGTFLFRKQIWWPLDESLSDRCIFWRLVFF